MEDIVVEPDALGGCAGSILQKSGNDVSFIACGKRLEAVRKETLSLKPCRVNAYTLQTFRDSQWRRIASAWMSCLSV